MKRVASLALSLCATSCDESVVWHELDPDLNRMLEQPRSDAYEPSPVFDDGKTMQSPPSGTMPRDLPPSVEPAYTRAVLEAGRARFEIVCAPCHGVLGDGVSVVASKMSLRKPPSLHEERLLSREPRAIVVTITEGFGLMPSYADVLSPPDRWAVAGYVKALQLSRRERVSDLPPELRAELAKEAP
jgi:mono/diheme cytochrome c family protein